MAAGRGWLTPWRRVALRRHEGVRLLRGPAGVRTKKTSGEISGITDQEELRITGTGKIQAKEAPQLCTIWCAKAAWPFLARVDTSHKAILHPTVVKHLTQPHNVSRDIHMLYSAVHKGALYIAVGAWQSPDGFDILGMVIY
ncbi:hypothetical protein PTTG_27971 [Puccinia triticina 1-1 BBBD Race 1]|uniref:Uncharacterized protein n=1 Tax=Puccinia triticina (isolate 1-1 / race 1 (BBBD)) TaxID=630390 RepID=A0A180GFX7_PUCT1|nr:hypothetical protein PTTG_27971 [Puccinia triticina 1-1 BBBD Race 1]